MNFKLIAISSAAVLAGAAHADLLAGWNFNDATAGSGGALGTIPGSAASSGTGSYTTNANAGTIGSNPSGVGSFAGTTLNAIGSDVAGQALAIQGGSTTGNTDNNGSYVQFSTSTAGFQDVVFSYATRGTSTGFTTQTVSYSIDGTNFTDFSVLTGRNVTTFSVQTIDLTSVTALNDQSSIFLRVSLSGATAQGGNNRFDNVQINANPVPEPASMIALGLGAVAVIRRRRAAK